MCQRNCFPDPMSCWVSKITAEVLSRKLWNRYLIRFSAPRVKVREPEWGFPWFMVLLSPVKGWFRWTVTWGREVFLRFFSRHLIWRTHRFRWLNRPLSVERNVFFLLMMNPARRKWRLKCLSILAIRWFLWQIAWKHWSSLNKILTALIWLLQTWPCRKWPEKILHKSW